VVAIVSPLDVLFQDLTHASYTICHSGGGNRREEKKCVKKRK